MKAKEEYLLEDGLVGDPNGVDQNSEGYKRLKQAIAERYSSYTESEKLNIKLDGIRFAMLDYLENESSNIIPPGTFLKRCLDVVMVNQKTFANYIDWDTGNLTKLLNGQRKINADVAMILEATFPVSASIWLRLEDKNELVRARQEKTRDYHQYSLKKLQQQVVKA
ncbi:transcriptional regulator [Pedobacter sp. JCM 36344]|uniref:helix-turn-helix transcriptional regulator n=1 Tax=Pedobacter sp. JCM 36344 TaxID=3374280 RepID=UPI00397878C1